MHELSVQQLAGSFFSRAKVQYFRIIVSVGVGTNCLSPLQYNPTNRALEKPAYVYDVLESVKPFFTNIYGTNL
jgi:hypothetical protein